MNPQPPHFIIEEGPERGRELTIPPEGARLGRATENDISIADAAMSRFQCRIYFREGALHVMDLGSTNETLLNEEPVVDQMLRHGDQILIGETMLRVVNDGLGEAPKPQPPASAGAAPAEPSPIVFQPEGAVRLNSDPDPAPILIPDEPTVQPQPSAAPAHGEEAVDLGLGRRNQMDGDEQGNDQKTNYLLITLVTVLVVMAVFVTVMFLTPPPANPESAIPQNPQIHVMMETVRAGEGNIFRYAVEIRPNGQIYAEIHDLANQRRIIREHQMPEEILERFHTQISNRRDAFYRLRDQFEGLPLDTNAHESAEITLIYGRDVRQVRVANQMEPDAFRAVREQIQTFVDNELNLGIISQPPEVLRAMADRAWTRAQQLYEERDVRNANLWEASQQLREIVWLLESIEPKPAFFRDAVRLQEEWRQQLEQRVRNLRFEAAREIQVGNRERAVQLYRRILATFPERSHPLFEMSYNDLIRLEQELRR